MYVLNMDYTISLFIKSSPVTGGISALCVGVHTKLSSKCPAQSCVSTSDLDFKVTTFYEVEYLKNGASWGQSYYTQ